ncbi:uncharacterized protein CPUR_06457 [Claviceps purpurea 20.1]|uniref:Uncharacterized protein n=1 Tax=Claviceps purpurea (strain 20.1) TaxID=1111077 RepID=M1VX88_CLAP2|nr:uncharacterized protein CPUR_06457 [Claviceps purpurea 20.1]
MNNNNDSSNNNNNNNNSNDDEKRQSIGIILDADGQSGLGKGRRDEAAEARPGCCDWLAATLGYRVFPKEEESGEVSDVIWDYPGLRKYLPLSADLEPGNIKKSRPAPANLITRPAKHQLREGRQLKSNSSA